MTSAASGCVGVRPLGLAARAGEARPRRGRGRPATQRGVAVVELGQRRRPRSRRTSTTRSRRADRRSATALRAPRTPTMTCASRQAIVVTGAGSGSGNAKSMVTRRTRLHRCVPVPRGRTFQAAGHRLPEVLVVGEAVEPGAQLARSSASSIWSRRRGFQARLSCGHGASLPAHSGQDLSAIGGRLPDRGRHDRAGAAAAGAAPAAAGVDRARARRAARGHRPQRAPRRRAAARPRLPRQRDAGRRRRLPAGRGHGAAAAAARRRGGDRHGGLAAPGGRRHGGRGERGRACGRSPSSTR